MDTEKITINIGAMDLGQIDMLVEQSFYTNRSDFIRTAIRNQIASHSADINNFKTSGMLGLDVVVSELGKIEEEIKSGFELEEKFSGSGVFMFDKETLEKFKKTGRKIKIKMVGMLIINKDVSKELAQDTFEYVKVYGIIKASDEVRELLQNLK